MANIRLARCAARGRQASRSDGAPVMWASASLRCGASILCHYPTCSSMLGLVSLCSRCRRKTIIDGMLASALPKQRSVFHWINIKGQIRACACGVTWAHNINLQRSKDIELNQALGTQLSRSAQGGDNVSFGIRQPGANPSCFGAY